MAIDPSEIIDLAGAPLRVSGNEGTVQERAIGDLIAADRYTQAQATAGPPYGMRISKLRFPGTQSGHHFPLNWFWWW